MIDMGVPPAAVIHKMTADGADHETIKNFQLGIYNDMATDKFESPRRCSNPSGDPIISKYVKMSQVGIPLVTI
jgi:hypothetical protein